MKRNTRTRTSRNQDESTGRSHANDGMKMHGSRSNDDGRELQRGRAYDDRTPPRKSNGRFTGNKRGH